MQIVSNAIRLIIRQRSDKLADVEQVIAAGGPVPERGGGEGGGGQNAPRQAVLLRGVVGLLHPTPGTNLEVERHNQPKLPKNVQFHLLINRQKITTTAYRPPGGRSQPTPTGLRRRCHFPRSRTRFSSSEPSDPPEPPTQTDGLKNRNKYLKCGSFFKGCETYKALYVSHQTKREKQAPGVRRLTKTAFFASHIFLASIQPTRSLWSRESSVQLTHIANQFDQMQRPCSPLLL